MPPFCKHPVNPKQRKEQKRQVIYKHHLVVGLVKAPGTGIEDPSQESEKGKFQMLFQPAAAKDAPCRNFQNCINGKNPCHRRPGQQKGNQDVQPQQPIIGKIVDIAACPRKGIVRQKLAGFIEHCPELFRYCQMLAEPVPLGAPDGVLRQDQQDAEKRE